MRIQKLLKNPGIKLAEQVAAARVKHSKMKLGSEFGVPKISKDFPSELIRDIAGINIPHQSSKS